MPQKPVLPRVTELAAVIATFTTLLLTGCGGGSSTGTGGGTGGSTLTCNTANYIPGAVAVPTAGDMATYAKTYSGNTGAFNTGVFTSDGGAAIFVLASSGSLTYNGAAQTVNSICKDTTLPMIYVEFGSTGAVDFMADASFTGHLPDMTGVYGAVPAGATPTVSSFTPATGAVGTSVDINGTNLGNFTPAPLVKFGTTTATVSSATSTTITVTVPAGLATGNSAITLSNGDGTGVVSVGTFNVTAAGGGGGAGAFPNEAITLPTTARNSITTPTLADTDLSSVVGTYSGIKAAHETNVLVSNYTTGTTLNSCDLTFAADRTVTLTADVHSYSQNLDGTANDGWTPALTAGQVNTGGLAVGPQTPAPGVTHIDITIGRGKVQSARAYIVADPFTPFTPLTEQLTCWMPINRIVGTAGSGWTQWLSYGSASDMPTTVTGTYAGSLFSAGGALAPAGATCQLVIAADGTMTFSTTGAAVDANFSAQIAGDKDDRVEYTNASDWLLRAKDINNQIDGTYNTVSLQYISNMLILNATQGTVQPSASFGYSCTSVVKQ
jgi:hypothetical protein